MKKAITLILAILTFSLTAVSCNDKKTESNASDNASGTVSQLPAPTARELLSKALEINGDEEVIIYDILKSDETSSSDEKADGLFLSDMYGTLETTVEADKIGELAVFLPEAQIANEVHIAKPKTEADTAKVKAYLQQRLDRLKEMFVGYLPEQAGIAAKGKLTEYKGYIFLVATKEKNDEVINAIKNMIDRK